MPCRRWTLSPTAASAVSPRKVKIEAAGGCLPPGCRRLSEILDQDLPGLDDNRASAVSKLVPDLRTEHKRKTNHIQRVSGVVTFFATEFHRGCGKVGKAARRPAQPPEADMKTPAALGIRGLGRHRQPPGLAPQRKALGHGQGLRVDFLIDVKCARRSRHIFTPRHAKSLYLPLR